MCKRKLASWVILAQMFSLKDGITSSRQTYVSSLREILQAKVWAAAECRAKSSATSNSTWLKVSQLDWYPANDCLLLALRIRLRRKEFRAQVATTWVARALAKQMQGITFSKILLSMYCNGLDFRTSTKMSRRLVSRKVINYCTQLTDTHYH